MILRPYQVECHRKTLVECDKVQRVLVVSATGTGKTIIQTELCKEFVKRGRVMFVTNRREILKQTANAIAMRTSLFPEIEQAHNWADSQPFLTSPVVVASINTLIAMSGDKRRYERFDHGNFSLVIIDECDLAVAKSYQLVMDWFCKNEHCKVVGYTATPNRNDGKSMSIIFDSCAFEFPAEKAVEEGWLVPLRELTPHGIKIDLATCRTRCGDLANNDLIKIMKREPVINHIASTTEQECPNGQRAIVFTPGVKVAELVWANLEERRPGWATFISGQTPKEARDVLMSRLRAGELRCLVNFGIATRGFDWPEASVMVNGRPTKSENLYRQMIGRIMRPWPGVVDGLETAEERRAAIASSPKPYAVVVNFPGNHGSHKIIRTVDVFAGDADNDVKDLAQAIIEESGEVKSIGEALKEAQENYDAKMARVKAETAKRAIADVKYVRTWSNPLDPLDRIGINSHSDLFGAVKWTPAQEDCLRTKFRIKKLPDVMTKAKASALIDQCVARSKAGLCSVNQAILLKRWGYDPANITGDEFGEIIAKKRQEWGRGKRKGGRR